MAWWEILILLFLAGGAAALSRCLYSGGITHCTGCGQCAKSGRCVYHAAKLEKKRESCVFFVDKSQEKGIITLLLCKKQ